MASNRPSADPTTEDFFKGPDIGESVPKFELPDQHGEFGESARPVPPKRRLVRVLQDPARGAARQLGHFTA